MARGEHSPGVEEGKGSVALPEDLEPVPQSKSLPQAELVGGGCNSDRAVSPPSFSRFALISCSAL